MERDRPKILVVDDEPANLELLTRMLRRRYDVHTASSGREALELLRRERFAAILSDQRMPHMSGTQFLAEARRLVPETVRMILTGYTAEQESLDAINVAQVSTFLTKPIAPEAVEKAVADAVAAYHDLVRSRGLLGELHEKNRELAEEKRLLELSLDERTRELELAQRRLESLALRDSLTGLYNHRFLQERLAEACERRARHDGTLALVLCDIDGFARYNEAHGHPAGDRLLVWLARTLVGASRATGAEARPRGGDTVARWGGDEFAILALDTDRRGAIALCDRVAQALRTPAFAGGAVEPAGPVTLSFGVAAAPEDADTRGDLLEAALGALARARREGGGRIVLRPGHGG